MKGFSRLFCFTFVSISLILLIDDSISLEVKISYNITPDYCKDQKETDAAAIETSYAYIDDQFRYDMCKTHFKADFDLDDKIKYVYKHCLGPRGIKTVYNNPCAVVCPSTLLIDQMNLPDLDDKQICEHFISKYKNMSRALLITDVDKECGIDHYCNPSGCCVKRGSTERPTTLPTTTPTNTLTTTSKATTVDTRQHLCTKEGTFKDPNDPTNRKYYKCVLKSQLKVCPTGQIFDAKQSHCIPHSTQPPTTPTITTDTTSWTHTMPTSDTTVTSTPGIDWSKYFHCTKSGYFANPYDCTQYYVCYQFEGQKQFTFASRPCPKGLVFIEYPEPKNTESTCGRQDQYEELHGTQCKSQPLPKLTTTTTTTPSYF